MPLSLASLFADPVLPSLPEAGAWLAALLVKGGLVLLAALVLARLLRGRSAALRHAVWALAFAALLALPLVAPLLPAWSVALAPAPPAPAALPMAPSPPVAPLPPIAPAPPRGEAPAEAPPASPSASPSASPRGEAGASDGAPPVGWTDAARARLDAVWAGLAGVPWGAWLVVGWGLGAALLLVRLAWHLARAHRLRLQATPVRDTAWTALARALGDDLGLRREVTLLRTEALPVPVTLGWRRPVVLLPAAADAWTPARRRVVLLHELAHVRRGDYATYLVAEVARALHWPNPLTWWGVRRLLVEREKACDDRVLTTGVDAPCYAAHLVAVARGALRGTPVAGALTMARPSELRTRVEAILDGPASRRALSRGRTVALVLAACALALPLAALRPAPVATPAAAPVAAPTADAPAADASAAPPRAVPADVEAVLAPAPVAPAPVAPAPVAPAPVAAPDTTRDEPPQAAPDTTDADDRDALADEQASTADEQASIADERARVADERAAVERERAALAGAAAPDTSDRANQQRALQERAVDALGQSSADAATERLAAIARTHPDAAIRAKAVYWLGQRDAANVRDLLTALAYEDASQEVQRRAAFALFHLPAEDAVPALIELTEKHSDVAVREQAVFWLGQKGAQEDGVLDALVRFAREADADAVQAKALFALAQLPPDVAVPALIDLAETHPSADRRKKAIFWLGQQGAHPEAVAALMRFTREDASADVQKRAVFALAQLPPDVAVPKLAALADDHASTTVREQAVFWLGQQGTHPEAVAALERFVQADDVDAAVQAKAVFALAQLASDVAVPKLIALARSHPSVAIREKAIFWLGQLDDPRALDALVETINEDADTEPDDGE